MWSAVQKHFRLKPFPLCGKRLMVVLWTAPFMCFYFVGQPKRVAPLEAGMSRPPPSNRGHRERNGDNRHHRDPRDDRHPSPDRWASTDVHIYLSMTNTKA